MGEQRTLKVGTSTYACTPCLLFRCCGVGAGDSSSSATEAAHFRLFELQVTVAALALGFCSPTDSMSDVSGVSDCSEVFVLNIGDLTVEGVAEADELNFARVLALVARAMTRSKMSNEGKLGEEGVLLAGGGEQEDGPRTNLDARRAQTLFIAVGRCRSPSASDCALTPTRKGLLTHQRSPTRSPASAE